ncbi:MAG: hypothetical protein AAB446_03370 [Patescibacteria group bacterium]
MFKFLKQKNDKGLSVQSGQAMIVGVLFFVFVSVASILGLTNPMVRYIAMATSAAISKESFYVAEAGMEDVVFRIKSGLPVAPSQTLNIGGHSVITTVADEVGGKVITAIGEANGYIRKIRTHLVLGSGISFHYGIQAGRGGFVLENSSSVTGNVHSSGPIIGAGNSIHGDVVSAGPTGIVDGIHADGSVYAHTIRNSVINKDAYYFDASTYSGNNVLGALHPGSPDQATAELPISDEKINEWEAEAEAGTVILASDCPTGTYEINSNVTLGPAKIECDLLIKGNGVTLTMAGPIWVLGNITTQTGPTIRMAAALGSQNVALIADNPADRAGSGIVDIGQSTQFQGSGFPKSFVFIISQNNSAETGGSNDAFVMGQSSGALVAYASHGQITLGQSVGVKEATAYKIVLKNTANVIYDTGLPSTLFSTGPAGGFEISGWKEVE